MSRSRLDEDAARRNAELIREKPEQVLTIITSEKSVFDRRDVARALHRYINDDPQEFQSAFAKVMASPALVELQPERAHVVGTMQRARSSLHGSQPAKWSRSNPAWWRRPSGCTRHNRMVSIAGMSSAP